MVDVASVSGKSGLKEESGESDVLSQTIQSY